MTLQVISLDDHHDHITSLTKNATLILPTPSIGNVSQLAMDLIIETTQAQRIARLHSTKLLPFVGVNPYSHINNTAYALELYHLPNTNTFLIQQRSPAAPGLQKDFAGELAAFIKEYAFSQVVVLSSLDGSYRRDAQLSGSQLRYWVPSSQSSKNEIESLMATECGIVPLEDEYLDGKSIQDKALPPWTVLNALSQLESAVNVAALLIFVLEGNNIPEALDVVECCVKIVPGLKSVGEETSLNFKQPESWKWGAVV